MKTTLIAAAAALFLAGCASHFEEPHEPTDPQELFMGGLNSMCRKTYEGRVVTNDAADADFRGKRLLMTVSHCTGDEVRIPFAVGEDRSRTWVVTHGPNSLRLKHDHRHEDGTEDVLSQYGGETVSPGTETRQEFPVDQFSKDLFTREGRTVSNTNVWAMEIRPGEMFAYELRRPGRHFRVEFDLTRPVAP